MVSAESCQVASKDVASHQNKQNACYSRVPYLQRCGTLNYDEKAGFLLEDSSSCPVKLLDTIIVPRSNNLVRWGRGEQDTENMRKLRQPRVHKGCKSALFGASHSSPAAFRGSSSLSFSHALPRGSSGNDTKPASSRSFPLSFSFSKFDRSIPRENLDRRHIPLWIDTLRF